MKGVSGLSSGVAIIDRIEAKKLSYAATHEIGHAAGLTHPFDNDAPNDLDLLICIKDKTQRSLWLSNCPQTTPCQNGQETIDNVMDYLPEYCGRKYTFTTSQISTMTKHFFNE